MTSWMKYLIVATSLSQSVAYAADLSKEEALNLGVDAYIYGYPLVTMDMTKQVMTNVVNPQGMRGPAGRMLNARDYPTSAYHDVTTPNADTLYSTAWLNLAKEPYILHVPNVNGRYYLMQMLDGWTNVFADPGTRTTGTKAHDFAIVGPNWHGTLPKGVTPYKSSTDMVWIVGRTYSTGTPEDYKMVHQIQDEYKLVPLSAYDEEYTPPEGKVDPSVDMRNPVRNQVNALDAGTYFKKLAKLMKDNPPALSDSAMVEKLSKLGIIAGENFDISKIDPAVVEGLNEAVKVAQQKIMEHEKNAGTIINGWTLLTKTGVYGTNYLQRAYVAAVGLGANKPQDAIYPATTVDNKGEKLNGSYHYIIHFGEDAMPPVKGFWSLTMYDDQYFFVDNSLKKYNVSSRNHFKPNADGSTDIYIQHDSPGKDKEANWLPAPEGDFVLMFRFYWPKESLIKGRWNLPGVRKV